MDEPKVCTKDESGVIVCNRSDIFNYYQQLEPIVLAHVERYQTDFTKHDKNIFDSGVNEFILCMRESGTDTAIIDFRENTTPESRLASKYIFNRGDRCFYGKDGDIREVDREEGESILERRIRETECQRLTPITEFDSQDMVTIFAVASDEIMKRQYYGVRTEPVIPKKKYTTLIWSNGGASWSVGERVPHENKIKLDANEIILPYRAEEVRLIAPNLPYLPLYEFSYEAPVVRVEGKDATDKTTRWALRQAESRAQDETLSETERMASMVLVAKYKAMKNREMEEWL